MVRLAKITKNHLGAPVWAHILYHFPVIISCNLRDTCSKDAWPFMNTKDLVWQTGTLSELNQLAGLSTSEVVLLLSGNTTINVFQLFSLFDS